MSFDLYVFDLVELPASEEAIAALLEDDESMDEPLTSRLAEFVAVLEERYPGLDDDDPDRSPWASWPLTQSMLSGRGCAFNIVWSAAETMVEEVTAEALVRGLRVYDPQSGSVTVPGPPTDRDDRPRRRWWRRAG